MTAGGVKQGTLDKTANKCETYVVIKVFNHEETIEGVVRSLILKLLKTSSPGSLTKIVIVDCGSTDNTLNIVKKLCRDYSFISYTTLEKYNKAKNEITK